MIAKAMHDGLVFAIIMCAGLWLARWGWRRAVELKKPRAHQVWCTACCVLCTLMCATSTIDDVRYWLALIGFIAGFVALTMSADVRYRK